MEVGSLYLYQGTMASQVTHGCAMQETVISHLWALPANVAYF